MGMMSNFQVEQSGSVEENSSFDNVIEIYPNPVSDHAMLKFSSLRNDTVLTITDERGAIVLKETLAAGMTEYAIIASHFASGNYTILLGKQKGKLLIAK